MDAQGYIEKLREKGGILRLANFDENGWCNGRGMAIVIDRKESMAIMLENCGRASVTSISTGAVVRFRQRAGSEPRIVGRPVYPNPAHDPTR